MTADVIVSGVTVQDFVGAAEADIATGLTKERLQAAAKEDSVGLSGWMESSSSAGMGRVLASHVVGFLQGDMAEIFAGVWNKCAEVRASAAATRGKAGETELVALLEHEFSYSMEPAVEIVVDGAMVGQFSFSIALKCAVKGLELEVRDGGIGGVRAGQCQGSASILLAGVEIWGRPLAHLDLPGEMRWKRVVRVG